MRAIRCVCPAGVFVCLLDAVLNHGVVTQRLLQEICTQRTGAHADHSGFGAGLSGMPPGALHLQRPDERRSVPLVLMTNLPLRKEGDGAGPFTCAELAEAYRQRQEVEVPFRLWSSTWAAPT